MVTIVGFGSLLSEKSARSTFGDAMTNFRLARMRNYRRVFAHPGSIFFERGIANLATKEISSLSVEPAESRSFLISVFDLPESMLPEFYEREEEYRIVSADFEELDGTSGGQGLMCTRWTDEEYIQHRGQETFDRLYRRHGVDTIWGWDEHSGILPCRVYLRHCLLSVMKLGDMVYEDFVQSSFLGDRKTTIKEYIAANPSIMEELPPAHLSERYNG